MVKNLAEAVKNLQDAGGTVWRVIVPPGADTPDVLDFATEYGFAVLVNAFLPKGYGVVTGRTLVDADFFRRPMEPRALAGVSTQMWLI